MLGRNLPLPANNDSPFARLHGRNQKIFEWLCHVTDMDAAHDILYPAPNEDSKTTYQANPDQNDDWQAIRHLCGYGWEEFASAGESLPLSKAEIDHFRRNHRDVNFAVLRDFMTVKHELPSPLAELYGLYRHRARLDAESAFFVAQATGSTRLARIMADLLAIGGFAGSLEYVTHLTTTYSVPCAFDTSDIIDEANHEAARRLALPIGHPHHLLRITPDEISHIASYIVGEVCLSPLDFGTKSNLLAEARQDVNRFPAKRQFINSVQSGDLPADSLWVQRIEVAYGRLLESWMGDAHAQSPVTARDNSAPIS